MTRKKEDLCEGFRVEGLVYCCVFYIFDHSARHQEGGSVAVEKNVWGREFRVEGLVCRSVFYIFNHSARCQEGFCYF